MTGLSGKYLAGIATLGERVVLILRIEEVLDFHELLTTSNED
jgi:purine-binding chemotaxis protein CheW